MPAVSARGYSGAGLDTLSRQFKALARKNAAGEGRAARDIARHANFVEPKLVAEIAFRGWTRDGLVRQGAFKGLRSDKPAAEIVKETPMPTRKVAKAAKTAAKASRSHRKRCGREQIVARLPRHRRDRADGAEEIGGVRVTHPDKVLFTAQDVTKRELIEHYQSVAKWMLPHIVERPISLVRCPQGSGERVLLPETRLGRFPGRVQVDPHQGKIRHRQISLYRGRART